MRRLMVMPMRILITNPAACAHTVALFKLPINWDFTRIPLADAVIELALSPKSFRISAIDAASTVRDGHFGDIPLTSRCAHQGAAKLGHGVDMIFHTITRVISRSTVFTRCHQISQVLRAQNKWLP